MSIPSSTLKPKEERRLLRGHLWAYRNEFADLPQLPDGALVDVFTSNRRFVGRGFYQASGGIGVRILSRRQEEIDTAWLRERLQDARRLRERLFSGSAVYRWVYGESDGLPGLVIDRYGDVAVVHSDCGFYQTLSAPLEQAILSQGVKGVLMRFGQAEATSGIVPDEVEVEFEELRVVVGLKNAQKTGLFLDQRLNAKSIVPLVQGLHVLDGHCHLGLWSVHAAKAGAASVTATDTSDTAILLARANAERNGVAGNIQFRTEAVETALQSGMKYDVVILDPPAYAKARAQTQKAVAKYQALNRLALDVLEPGGYLVTCSCSHFVDLPLFHETIKRAAAQAGKRLAILDTRGAAPDHPVLMAMPETAYLKCLVCRVVE